MAKVDNTLNNLGQVVPDLPWLRTQNQSYKILLLPTAHHKTAKKIWCEQLASSCFRRQGKTGDHRKPC